MTRRRWTIVLRCLPLVLLAVVLWRVKPWTVQLSQSAPWALAASILVNFVAFLPLKAARWRVALTDPPPYRQVLAATIEGVLANNVIGFGSGDLLRAARLRQERRLAVDYASTWAERGAEVLALAIMTLLAALLIDLGTAALALSGVAVAGFAAVVVAGRSLVPRLARWPRVQQGLSSGLQASTPRRLAAMVALSLLGWCAEIVMLMLFQGAFHIEPSARTALLTIVGINAAIVIPTLPGNFGTVEAGATVALVMCGVPRDVAVSYALTYHVTQVTAVALLATAVFLYRTRRYRTTPAGTSI